MRMYQCIRCKRKYPLSQAIIGHTRVVALGMGGLEEPSKAKCLWNFLIISN